MSDSMPENTRLRETVNQAALAFKKKKKNVQMMAAFFFVALIFMGIICGYGWQSIIAGALLYILNEVLWTDHLFYDVSHDYNYQLNPDETHAVTLSSIALPATSPCSTWLLPIKVKATVSGWWFDPYVVISDGQQQERQYVERRVRGLRYINVSNFSEALNKGKTLHLAFHHCIAMEDTAELLGFKHPDYTQKQLMIIAPHADDAEIAAFGLYSQTNDVHIVTLTAGEVEMEAYAHVYTDPAAASRLKGRLRAMDGIAVPLWGGVPQTNCINLGYFCKQLPLMCKTPDIPIASLTADIKDTRLFRQYNTRTLLSDNNGLPTWNNLVQDLVELIDAINPEIILTTQPELDPHPDHIYGTKALLQALQNTVHQPEDILYYANHHRTADMFPFGPEHTVASLPPHVGPVPSLCSVVSFPLSMDKQKEKIFALEMMHDLKGKASLKKRIRAQLQRLAGRTPNRYGDEGYFRKAIKCNEVFYR